MDWGKILFVIVTVTVATKFIFIKLYREISTTRKVKKSYSIATGHIVEINDRSDLDGLKMHYVIVEYIANGVLYRVRSDQTSMNKPQIGRPIAVYYNATKPNDAIVYSPYRIHLLFFKIFFLAIILIAVLVSLFFNLPSLVYPQDKTAV